MIHSKSPKIETSSDDDFLYKQLNALLSEIKLARGGTFVDYTLRNHRFILEYLMSKQIQKIQYIESTYFNPDGTLNSSAVSDYHSRSGSLHS